MAASIRNVCKKTSFCKNCYLNRQLFCKRSVNRYYSSSEVKRPVVSSTIDEGELKRFATLSHTWWNENGEFEALHNLNKLRIPMIRDTLISQGGTTSTNTAKPLEGLKILDAGCGGGLITEPLARLGAFVIGVDAEEENISVAQSHLMEEPSIVGRVKYITATVEELVGTEEETFDAVIASEVVEHVADLTTFVGSCCRLVKPGGSLFITTMNKTTLAYMLAVFAAENIVQVVPRGTHDWDKFEPPEDLQFLLSSNGMSTRLLHGICYNPLTRTWNWIKDTSVNYAIHAVKMDSTLHDRTQRADNTECE